MPNRWKKDLDQVINELRESPRKLEYNLNWIFRTVRAPSVEALALELTERVRRGELKAIYRVLSPDTKSGIAEYKDFLDIPEEVYDDTADRTIQVVPSRDLEIIYKAAA
jgi:hypothetical protein